jgi:hypothetical protein
MRIIGIILFIAPFWCTAQTDEQIVEVFYKDTALMSTLAHYSGGLIPAPRELCSDREYKLCFRPQRLFRVDSFAIDLDGQDMLWVNEAGTRSGPYWAPKDLRLRVGDIVYVMIKNARLNNQCMFFVYLDISPPVLKQ